MSVAPNTSLPEYTLVGTPFSTFTRTIAIALVEKGIPFKQVRATAHSEVADEFHPYGYLPILVIPRPNGTDVHLRESQAIATYLDRVAPTPSLGLDETEACVPEKMWEFVSFVVSFGELPPRALYLCTRLTESRPQVTRRLRVASFNLAWTGLMLASLR